MSHPFSFKDSLNFSHQSVHKARRGALTPVNQNLNKYLSEYWPTLPGKVCQSVIRIYFLTSPFTREKAILIRQLRFQFLSKSCHYLLRTRSFQIRSCPFIGTVVCHVTVVCTVGSFICYPSVKIAQAHGLVYKHQLHAVS